MRWSRSRAAEKWLRGRGAGHVLFKICSTFDSTDAGNIGPVMDALRADSGDAIVLVTPAFPETGRTVYLGNLFVGARAAEREPAEGSSAQSDARLQSGAGAGAAEPDQDRAVDLADIARGRGCGPRAACRSRRKGRWRCDRRCGLRSRSRNDRRGRARSSRSRSAHPASGLGSPARWWRPAGSNRAAAMRVADAPVGGPAACLPAVARRRRCSRSPAPKRRCRCCISIPTGHRRQGRSPACAGLGHGTARRRPGADRQQFDAGRGRGAAVAPWPRCGGACHRAGDGRYR